MSCECSGSCGCPSVIQVNNPTGDGFGIDPIVTPNGAGSVTITDADGNQFQLDVCDLVSQCPSGPGDGFGANPTVTDNGDGSVTVVDQQGNEFTIDVCNLGQACNFGFGDTVTVTDNTDGTATVNDGQGNSFTLDVCALIQGCDWSQFPLPEVAAGPGVTVTSTTGPGGETIYTVTADEGIGPNVTVTDPGDGTLVINDGEGNTVALDICAAVVNCDIADGIGTNTTSSVPGDGTVVITDEKGNTVTVDVCAAIAGCDPTDIPTAVVDNNDGTITINGVPLDVCAVVADCDWSQFPLPEVAAGTGVTVTTGTGANGQTIYTVNAEPTVDLRLVSGVYNPATNTIELIVDDGAGGGTTTINIPVPEIAEEIDNTVTSAAVGTPAPSGIEWGVDPATGDIFYVDSAGNWAAVPSDADGIGASTTVTDPGNGTLVINDGMGNTLTLDICAAIQNCTTGGGDGLGPNTTTTIPGDGTVVVTDDQGNSVTVDVCAAIAGCDPTDIPTSIVDQGDGTVLVNGETLDVCAAVADCDWTQFPLPVVQGGDGATVTTTTGPAGETIYTVDVDCPALQAVECWEAPAGAGGTQQVTPTGINNRFQDTAAFNDFNAVMGGSGVTLTAPIGSFTDPFVNPSPGNGLAFPNGAASDQLWNLNLPAGTTEITLCLSEASPDNAFGYGAYLFDVTTMQTLEIVAHTGGVFGGTGTSGIGLANNGTGQATWDLGAVDPANVRMIAGTVGTNNGTVLTDEVAFTCADATVTASGGDLYTVTRCPDGTATAVNQTDGTDIVDVSAGIPAGWTACVEGVVTEVAAGDNISVSTSTGPAGETIFTIDGVESVIEAGPGVNVTAGPGPNPGETVYTVEFDPATLTATQLDDLCAALAANGCDLAPPQLDLALSLVGTPNTPAPTTSAWNPVPVGQVDANGHPGNWSNNLSASPNLFISTNVAADFPDAVQNPVTGTDFVHQVYDPQLPLNTSEFSGTFSDPLNADGAYGVTAFDVTTGLTFPPLGDFAGSVTIFASNPGTWRLPPGVDAADVRLLLTGVGGVIAGQSEQVAFSNLSATVTPPPTTIDFVYTVTNNGTAPVAGTTVDLVTYASGQTVTPDPIPAGGTASGTFVYTVTPTDLISGNVQEYAEITQQTTANDLEAVDVRGGTQKFECNQLVFSTRAPGGVAPQDAASILEGSTALDFAGFSAPGFFHDLGTTLDGPFDTIAELDLPATATGFTFSVNLSGGAAGPVVFGFIDLATGLRVDMSALTGPGTVNAPLSGITVAAAGNGVVSATLPAGIDPRTVGLVLFDAGAAGAGHKFLTFTNFNCV